MDLLSFHMPVPLALALVAAIGYMVGLFRSSRNVNDLVYRSQRELRRAQMVATELEKIAGSVRQNLARHHSSLARFKERVGKLSQQQQEAAWRDLCREAEEMLKPTLRLATQIAHAYDEIRQQSSNLMAFTEVRTDPLTGVNNRRGLDDALANQFALMNRYGANFSVVIFDIDHFKQVNDEHGHLHGDRVLQELGRLLDESVRETDIVGRFGGEEFLVIMPRTDLEGACIFSDRVRAVVESHMTLTISGGVAVATDGDTRESLLARADTALYSAKTAGRNRVYRHTGEEADPVTEEPVAVGQATEGGILQIE